MARVSMSEEINAPAARVWELIGGFNDLPDWHPAVARSEVDGEGVGSVRTLTLGDGAVIRERLDAHDDAGRSCSYTITESPLPVANYQATIRVAEGGPDSCTIHWSSSFEAAGAPEAEAVELIEGIYRAGIDNVKKLVAG